MKRQRPIENHTHADNERVNNPPVGLVTPETDEDVGKKTHQHDSPIDLQPPRHAGAGSEGQGARARHREATLPGGLVPHRSGKQRIGFLAGEVEVPEDFDAMGGEDIRRMFEGSS